jgi:hypothetical protein
MTHCPPFTQLKPAQSEGLVGAGFGASTTGGFTSCLGGCLVGGGGFGMQALPSHEQVTSVAHLALSVMVLHASFARHGHAPSTRSAPSKHSAERAHCRMREMCVTGTQQTQQETGGNASNR